MKSSLTFTIPWLSVKTTPTTQRPDLWNGQSQEWAWNQENWGDIATAASTESYWIEQKMDISALTTMQEKVIFPYATEVETIPASHEVGLGMSLCTDTLIISRVPLESEVLNRIPRDHSQLYGDIIPGTLGSFIDAEHILYWRHTEYRDDTGLSPVNFTIANVSDGGSFAPTASDSIWVYRVIMNSIQAMQNSSVFYPSVRLTVSLEQEREDNIPYLARRILSVRSI